MASEIKDYLETTGVVKTGYQKTAEIHENMKHLQGYFPCTV